MIRISMMQAIKDPFVTSVKEAIGNRCSASLDIAYHKTIKFILTTLTTGFMYNDTEDDGDSLT